MKRLVFVTAIALVLGFAPGAHATLTGYDNGLFVYDSTTNLTWYDPLPTPMTWSVAYAWAQSLSVTINGISVTGWRLPTTPATTPGYIDEGEMGTSTTMRWAILPPPIRTVLSIRVLLLTCIPPTTGRVRRSLGLPASHGTSTSSMATRARTMRPSPTILS